MSNTLNDRYFRAVSMYFQGCVSLGENDYSNALKMLGNAKDIVESLPENEKTAILKVRIHLALGACHLKAYMLPQAYQHLQQGLDLNKKLSNKDLQHKLENNLLITYRFLGMYDEIITMSKWMLADTAYSDHFQKYFNIATAYYEIAEYQKEKHFIDTAEIYLDSALLYAQNASDIAYIDYYKGSIDYEKGKYLDAIADSDHGLAALANDNELEANLLINKGKALAEMGRYDNALILIDSALCRVNPKDFIYIKEKALKHKRNILYKLDEFEECSRISMYYDSVRDSLSAIKNVEKLSQLENTHQIGMMKEQMEQAQLVKDLKNQRQRLVLYLMNGFLAFVALTVYLLLKLKLKNKQLQEEAITRELDQRNRELTAKSLEPMQGKVHKDFDYYFTQTHPDFYKNLSRDFPDLTPNEMHLCAYIRLELSTKDIAEIQNIAPASVRMARHRLRRSLGITDSAVDLSKFLSKY